METFPDRAAEWLTGPAWWVLCVGAEVLDGYITGPDGVFLPTYLHCPPVVQRSACLPNEKNKNTLIPVLKTNDGQLVLFIIHLEIPFLSVQLSDKYNHNRKDITVTGNTFKNKVLRGSVATIHKKPKTVCITAPVPNSSHHLDLFNSYVGRYDGELGHRKSAKAVSCTPTLMVTISFPQTERDIFLRNACSYAISRSFLISIYEQIFAAFAWNCSALVPESSDTS